MDPATITAFLAIGFIVLIGFFGNLIFTRTRIPDILILIAVGMILGPDILGNRFGIITTDVLFNIDNFKNIILSAALIIILFDGGLGLELRSITESMRATLFFTVIAFTLTTISVGSILFMIMRIDVLVSFCLGAIVGGTSSAIVLPIVSKMRIHARTKTMLSMESVLTDVLVIVVALTILSIISIGEFSIITMVKDILSKLVVGIIVGFIAGIGWLFILQRLQNQPFSYMLTIAALFIMAGLVEIPPLESSGAVAALAFGLAISNRESVAKKLRLRTLMFSQNNQIQQFHSEITFFVRTFFFVYLGMFFRFGTFTEIHLVAGLLIISMVVLARWVVTLLIWRIWNLEGSDAIAVFSLMPRGLAAAVLATLPPVVLASSLLWNNSLGFLFLNATLVVILGTTILTTIFVFFTEKVIDRKKRKEFRETVYSKPETLTEV